METIPLGALVSALVFLIILSAFFSASEISMMALNRYRLKHLVESGNYEIIDCQLATSHLRSLGAIEISREEFEAALDRWTWPDSIQPRG